MKLLDLWGKTADAGYHPVLYHMLDTGHVARAILECCPQWRKVAGAVLGDAAGCEDVTAYVAALHDLGKISAAFQGQVEEERARLESQGWSFVGWPTRASRHHTLLGQAALLSDGAPDLGLGPLESVAGEVMGGHHGAWQTACSLQDCAEDLDLDEPPAFAEQRVAAVECLQATFVPGDPPQSIANVSTASMFLTGLAILADWIASDTGNFAAADHVPLDEYTDMSHQQAHDAVARMGLSAPPSPSPTAFVDLFPKLGPPRPLQRAVDSLDDHLLAQPSLTIMEAPTGEGKTEAALALAHRIGALRGTEAFYYALPTMATSNQMYTRVDDYLRDNLRLDAGVRLVHGQAQLAMDLLSTDGHAGHPDSDVISDWFAPRKRALLAPYGVGTVDQTELAALNVRHAALRMLGLSGQTVIIDEIHAYDVYMTTVIERLLRWLSQLETSIMLLSATLPQDRVRRLQAAWGQGSVAVDEGSYPRLVVVGNRGGSRVLTPRSGQNRRKIAIQPMARRDEEAAPLAEWLLDQVRDGGCAAYIANTVKRAQDVYRALQDAAPVQDLSLHLIHARFPMAERLRREKVITEMYGLNGESRPARGIVVGTQVLEQSLDLDFDLMLTDIAPIDLLLQRVGRLHRHERDRPAAHTGARLVVVMPDDPEALGASVDAAIYAPYLLARTARALAEHALFDLPHDYRPLVEGVYGPEDGPDLALDDLRQALARDEANATKEAKQRLLEPPDAEECFCRKASEFTFSEDEDSDAWIVARTRLGPPSVTVIPLERDGSQVWVPGTDGPPFDLDAKPNRKECLRLSRQQVRISGGRIVSLVERARGERCRLWDAPLLRHMTPLWLKDGATELGDGAVRLTLDPELGLVTDWCKGGRDE